jgi:hypothetical protein
VGGRERKVWPERDLPDNESPRLVAYGSFLSARERLSRFYVYAAVLRAYERQERSKTLRKLRV